MIPTCVNEDVFVANNPEIRVKIRNELSILPHEKVMVYSGSLGANYNVNILLNAFESFLKVHPDSKLLILSKVLEMDFPELPEDLKGRIIHRLTKEVMEEEKKKRRQEEIKKKGRNERRKEGRK